MSGEGEEQPEMPSMVAWDDPKKLRGSELSNPGKWDQFNKETQTILQVDLFDGVRFDISKMTSPIFYIGHHLTIPSTGGPQATARGGPPRNTGSYGLSANYVPNNDNLIGGRIDPAGNLTARLVRQLCPGLSTKIEAQLPPRPDEAQVALDLDWTGKYSTLGAKWVSGNSNSGAQEIYSYTQALTPNLSAGMEGFRHPDVSYVQLASRYETERWVGHGVLMLGRGMNPNTGQTQSHGQSTLSYMRKASARVGLATSLHYNLLNHDTSVEAAYSFNLRQANVKARIDTSGTIGCLLEEKITPGFMLQLSGSLDHASQDYKFGVGINLG